MSDVEVAGGKGEVFISYASHDRPVVLRIAEHLEAAGVKVWMDRSNIEGGAKWAEEIVTAIEAAPVVVLMCTDASMRSWAVKQEIQLAGESRKPLLPIILERTSFPAQMKFFLAGLQWIEVLDRPAAVWLPQILQALSLVGVAFPVEARKLADGKRMTKPMRFDWNWQGLVAIAAFTDQIWPVLAENSDPSRLRLTRDLGAPQEGVHRAFPIGSRLRLHIELQKPGYVIVLDRGPQGSTYCLCPSRFAPTASLPRGISILPQSPRPWDVFMVSGRHGREEILAIVSDEPLGFDWMPADPTAPARILDDSSIARLLSRLRDVEGDRWAALGTYFDVTAPRAGATRPATSTVITL